MVWYKNLSAQLHAESAISHSQLRGYRDKDDNYNITARAVARAVMRGPKKGLNRQ